MKKIPIWIDLDTGVDDAIAILCALKLDNLDIVGMSSGVGTTTLENTFKNTRNVLALGNRKDIKVYPGATSSWIEEYRPAPEYHGENGIGNILLEDSDAPIENKHAWDAIYEKAKELNGELIIVTTGQLTNIANAIVKYPDITKYIKQISFMGGAIDGGNTTLSAEANIIRDPHAAECIMKSNIKLKMFGLDVTEKAYITIDDLNKLNDNKINNFIKEATKIPINTNIKNNLYDHYCIHDVVPLIELIYPELFKSEKAGVHIETNKGLTYGKTVSDLYVLSDHKFKEKNCEVFIDIDTNKFSEIIINLLNSY